MADEYDNDYQVLNIDLAPLAGTTKNTVVQNGRPVAAVGIIALPVAAVGNVFLRFGETGDPIPIRQEAMSIGRSPARSSGVFLDVAAGQAGILTLLIGIDIGLQS